MGNGCTCYKDISIQEIKNDTFIDIKNEQVQTTNLYEMVKYFDEMEKENTKNEKKKIRKMLSFKKLKNSNTIYNNNQKYELMLKRLLEQQNKEKKGPKRRETIRQDNNKKFIKLIHEAIEDNKNKEKHLKNIIQKKESILLNPKDKMNLLSISSGKQSVIINKIAKKNFLDNLGETNTDNEIKPTCGNITSDIKKNE